MQKTILLADDDLAVKRMLCRVLAEENYSVIPAVDGEDMLNRLKRTSVDLVLLDLSAPDSGGSKMLHRIRIENPSVPVIIISSKPSESIPEFQPGMGALMEKPLDLFKLLRTIDDLLRNPIEA